MDDEEDEGEDDGEHVHNLHDTLGHHQHNPHHLDPHHHDPHHLVDPQSHLHYANMNSMQMHGMGDSSMIHHQQHLTAAAMSQSHHLSGIPPHLQMSLPPGVGGGGIGMPNPQQQQQYAMLQQFQQHQQQHYMQQQQQQQQQQQIPRNMGMPSEYH